MKFGSHTLMITLSVVISFLAAGCAPAPPPKTAGHSDHDHDHDHGHGDGHPETLAQAVEQIVSLNMRIKQALEAKDTRGADGPVHAIGHVLEDVSGLAEQAGLSEEQRTAVHQAIQTLFAAFADIDSKIHGKEGKDYSEVAADIEGALSVLQEHAQPAAPPANGDAPATGDQPPETKESETKEPATEAPPAAEAPSQE